MASSISKQTSRATVLALRFVIFAPGIEHLGTSISAATLWE